MAMATEFLPTLTYDDTPGIRRPSCPPCMTSRRSPTGRRQSPQPLMQRSLLSPASSSSNSPAAPPRHSQFQASSQSTQATIALPSAVRQKSHSLSSLLLLSTTGNQQQTCRATSPSNNAIALSASGTAGAGAAQYGTEAEIEEEAPSPSYRLSSTPATEAQPVCYLLREPHCQHPPMLLLLLLLLLRHHQLMEVT
jgi:hypothetical protein